MNEQAKAQRAVRRYNRRGMLKRSVAAAGVAAAACAGGGAAGALWLQGRKRAAARGGKKVIVIGIDGMDPRLSERMMEDGLLPHLAGLRAQGGYRRLGSTIPPQSPVAWASFINGAGPGSHGIFDFIHRHSEEQCQPFFAVAETIPGEGYWEVGDFRLQLNFWPFSHRAPTTVLRRQGVPFWDYLDAAGIPSTFYNLPSNYPPSPSRFGNHRCLAGMGTPDLLGTYGTYQYFAEDGPWEPMDEAGGRRSQLFFRNETAAAQLVGPDNEFLKQPRPVSIDFLVHRDRDAGAVAIEIQGRKILLRRGEWSPWIQLDVPFATPAYLPDKKVGGTCRFFLQEVAPICRLYVTPINADPSRPVLDLSEPSRFVQDLSRHLGLFYTTGFQEDHKALSNGVFSDDDFVRQADMVLEERLALLDHALADYDDGLLFFYFSSTDLQSHMLWWDSELPHPTRSASEAKQAFGHIQRLYQRLDGVVGQVLSRYGDRATVIVMSDHGFANFGRQFNINTWLSQQGYLGPAGCTSVLDDVDWSRTTVYGMGINGLYLNLKGRERYGIVEPGTQREQLLAELVERLPAVRDEQGQQVIRCVHRADQAFTGSATALAPDLIVGYRRGYRTSWDACLGGVSESVVFDNDSAWSADHCADVSEVPGVLFCNRSIGSRTPSLVDLAPSIMTDFGLPTPSSMEGRNLFTG